MAAINFFSEEVKFTLKNKRVIRAWISATIQAEGYELEELNFIFCSDEYLLKINKEYLKHHDYTDVITFDNSEVEQLILGDIFISIDRVKENAKGFKSTINKELCRVMIHGTLHLLGYKDKKKTAKKLMTEKEDFYLEKLRL